MKKIYINGTFLTMNDKQPKAEAMAEENGTILMIGTKAEVMNYADEDTEIIDLQKKTILPSFVDAHGHFLTQGMAFSAFADGRCYPIGTITKMDELLERLKQWDKEHPEGKSIVALNFDDTLIKEYRMPTAEDLDLVSVTKPVYVIHATIHMASINSKAMEEERIDASYHVDGGTVYLKNGKPLGVFEENAMSRFISKIQSKEALDLLKEQFSYTVNQYLSKGVTTVCEGAGMVEDARIIVEKIEKSEFPMRYIMCPAYRNGMPGSLLGEDGNRIINGPVKFILDGSIQIYTAGMGKPYYTSHPTRQKPADYCGFTRMEKDDLVEALKQVRAAGKNVAMHCNGDATIDLVLDAYLESGCVEDKGKRRDILIHAQCVREDQLERIKEYGLMVSFFPEHIFVWGDRHYSTFLGPERANRLNPVGSAAKRGIVYSLHNDAPVTPCWPMSSVKHAVCRRTSGGRVLGEEYAISVEAALKGVTIYAAYQYGLDQLIGSLEKGKKADFIMLDQNPLLCEKEKLREIEVEKVWFEGKLVYTK